MHIVSQLASVYFRSATGWLGGKVVAFSLLGLLNQSLLTRNRPRADYELLTLNGTGSTIIAPPPIKWSLRESGVIAWTKTTTDSFSLTGAQ